MKKWIHSNQEVKTEVRSSKQSSMSDVKKAFDKFKSKYPKAYEVLGR